MGGSRKNGEKGKECEEVKRRERVKRERRRRQEERETEKDRQRGTAIRARVFGQEVMACRRSMPCDILPPLGSTY